MVTAGVVFFNFGAPVKAGKGGQSDSAYGLALIAFSLALDGATGGIQVCGRSFNAFFLDQIFMLVAQLRPFGLSAGAGVRVYLCNYSESFLTSATGA